MIASAGVVSDTFIHQINPEELVFVGHTKPA